MRKLIFSLLLCILLFPLTGAEATQTDPDRPDVSTWKEFSRSNISIRISDQVPYYLGFDMIYQNPNDKNEFVRQIKVLIPFASVKSRATQDKNYVDTMVSYVTDGAERELLKAYLTKSDPVLYIRWRVKDDFERDTVMLDNKDVENEVWFWNSAGTWVYVRNMIIKTAFPSEIFADLDDRLFIVGVKYSLNKENYNSREVPHALIYVAVKASKEGK